MGENSGCFTGGKNPGSSRGGAATSPVGSCGVRGASGSPSTCCSWMLVLLVAEPVLVLLGGICRGLYGQGLWGGVGRRGRSRARSPEAGPCSAHPDSASRSPVLLPAPPQPPAAASERPWDGHKPSPTPSAPSGHPSPPQLPPGAGGSVRLASPACRRAGAGGGLETTAICQRRLRNTMSFARG